MKTTNTFGKNEKREARHVIPLINWADTVPPIDIESILEFLKDHGYLNERGIAFKSAFWYLIVKKLK